MPSISWLELDINKGTFGYLDSVEVNNARSKGIDNVFVGMIQQDYDGTINVDKIIEDYRKESKGRMPIFGTQAQRENVITKYRELSVLQCKLDNLKSEFDEKYGINDLVWDFLSKLKIVAADKEYIELKEKIKDTDLQICLKKQLLYEYVDKHFYQYPHVQNTKASIIYTSIPKSALASNY